MKHHSLSRGHLPTRGDTLVCAFVIPGQPVPWARAAQRRDGSGKMSTLPRQRAYKKLLAEYARAMLLQAGFRRPLEDAAFILDVKVFLPVPASWARTAPAKYARAMAGAYSIDRPDLDNWVKLPMDAFNGLAWVDDAQVVDFGDSGKWHDHARPRMEVELRAVTL